MEGSASQAGFYYQNNVAALKILESLFFNSDISHIRLENYDKGHHIDDIIVYRNNTTQYYQVKWSDDGENSFTLYNLLTAAPPKKSIFRQLADGYLSVKSNSDDFSIILFTTKRESSQRRPSEGLSFSLAEIRSNIIEPLKGSTTRYDALPNYQQYQDTLEKVRLECNLDVDSFDDFLRKLEFQFSQEPVEQIQNAAKFKLSKLGIEENLLNRLIDSIVKWSISGEVITRDKVIGQLGLHERFEDKLSHYFRVVDDKYYVPNHDFFQKLSRAINELKGGYIFIEGLPGTGKSTALTKFKEENPDITLAYYCFIPDARNDFGELRHKANYFVKSLCIAIENNFPDLDLPNRYSDKYEEKLSLYIDKLGQLQGKVIFIIDGLDHVHRDIEFKENSLLNQIKGNLPDGVFFLLSSQYKTVLSPSVAIEVESDPRRHINVSHFTQQEIHQYLLNKEIQVREDVLDRIEKLSNGIPLYLHYISELLVQVGSGYYDEILDDLPSLTDGKINSYHEYLFKKAEDNEAIKWTLAVLAYRKENSTVATIVEILKLAGLNVNVIDIQKVLNDYSHLIRQADGRSYTVFHNSFREFIISKTLTLQRDFNKALVAFYENAPFSDDAYRNYFRHLFEIGEFKRITEATTIEWIKNAWANFRSLQEIKENISIALDACVECVSLSEFIRIGFIKAQVGRLAWNFENSEIDFPSLFLKVGLESNSIRTIWDGDFVLTSKEYFAYYLGEYFAKNGSLLPQQVLKHGFAKKQIKKDPESLTRVFQAEALACNDIKLLFEDIDAIKWVRSEEHQDDYLKEPHSQEENAKINMGIKFKVIDNLYKHKHFNHLRTLAKAYGGDDRLGIKIQVSLAMLLMPNDKVSAVRILKKVELCELSNEIYFELICFSSDYFDDNEIKEHFGERTVLSPKVHEELVNTNDAPYGFRKDVLELFEALKPVWIYQPELVQLLQLRVSTLPSPAKNFYNSILYLSELWYLDRSQKLAEPDRVIRIKKTLEELYVRRGEGFRKVSQGLFDSSPDDFYIAGNVDKLFKKVFTYVVETSSSQNVEEIIQHWFRLEKGEDGYRSYKVALRIAEVVHKSKYQNLLSTLVYSLLQHAEAQVRQEEGTSTLLDNLGNVVEVYGSCGFREDFARIYNQLIEIAFGVAHRKDYQASYIIDPLKLMHEVDPEGSLGRLKDVLDIQHQLADAGNARMHHICLSELIAFTAKHYPELAFTLLEKEEENIGRDEAIKIVVEPLIKSSSAAHLHLFFGLIKTLPRWDTVGTRDNYFLTLAATLLERTIEINEEAFIPVLLNEVKLNTIVELEDEAELGKFSEILIKYGKDYGQYGLPSPKKEKEQASPKKRIPQGEKFSITYSRPEVDYLIDLFEDNYAEFEKVIYDSFEICLKNRRNQTFRNEYYRSKPIIEKFYNTCLGLAFETDIIGAKRLIRYYIEFKNKVIEDKSAGFLKSADLKERFNAFIVKANLLFPDDLLKEFVEKEFALGKWMENILQFINEYRDHIFLKVVPEEGIYRIVNEVSLLESENLLEFVDKWASGKIAATAKLLIANRLFSVSPKEAKVLLLSLVEGEDNLFYLEKQAQSLFWDNVIDSFISSNPDEGKRFLLRSYLSQKGNYDDSFISGMDLLLKFKRYFDHEAATRTYFNSNLLYNKELTKGLPLKENRYEFITGHCESLSFNEVIIKHLIYLLDYPVVKIREQALQSLYDLIVENLQYLDKVVEYGIVNGNDNKAEHTLVLFNALSLKIPNKLLPFKNNLLSALNRSHFNILESIRGILIRLDNHSGGFLSHDERAILQRLNTEVPIFYDKPLLNIKKGRNFIFSKYHASLLREIYNNEEDNSDVQDDVYTDLVNKGFGNYSHEQEGAVHRRYNINTNFDAIEINSLYHDEIQSSINRIFNAKIKRGCFDPNFISTIGNQFRLYDPSRLLAKVRSKPGYINWLPSDISDIDFINFNDFESLINKFVRREEEYITLYEYGSQRPGNNYIEKHFTCYFEVYAYLKMKDFDDTILGSRISSLSPIIKEENLFTHELPAQSIPSTSFPIKEIKPLLEISYNNFRGEDDLANAFILSDVLDDMNLKGVNLTDVMLGKENYPIEAFRWQNAYTSGAGRRRYKPTSQGYTLKIRKDILLEYIDRNEMSLCYDVSLRRSNSKFIPESHMEWYNMRKMIEMSTM